jgi:phi LC3 family holin
MENNDKDLKIYEPQLRWKSWAVWVSVAGAVWIILSAFCLPEKWGIEEGTFRSVLNAVGTILTGFGILNNPTDRENF